MVAAFTDAEWAKICVEIERKHKKRNNYRKEQRESIYESSGGKFFR